MFKLRIGGSNDFVSKIDPYDPRCFPPGSVDVVEGWDHPSILKFDDQAAAKRAARQVGEIEGFHISIEEC